jgi:predicted amidohydrolase
MAVVSKKVRVAVVPAAPVHFDTRRSLRKLADLTANAVQQGAELVVFPGAYVAGYPDGHDFGVSGGDGSTLPVVATNLGRIGSVICRENDMPLLRTAMYAKGIELYCALTVDDREAWLPTVTHIALEGRCFVLSACQVLRCTELPSGYPRGGFPGGQDVLIRGGSCIIGPPGQPLAGPKYGEECILTADLDRADLARAKFDFDVVGHYSRPDVFRSKSTSSR